MVPTWNYVVVHAWGRLRIIDDLDWLREHVGRLTDTHEASRPSQWAVGDAPEPFIASQLKGILGVAMTIERIEGKVKWSQNRTEADRSGVAAGLAASA